jgi:hypothetical protein
METSIFFMVKSSLLIVEITTFYGSIPRLLQGRVDICVAGHSLETLAEPENSTRCVEPPTIACGDYVI